MFTFEYFMQFYQKFISENWIYYKNYVFILYIPTKHAWIKIKSQNIYT